MTASQSSLGQSPTLISISCQEIFRIEINPLFAPPRTTQVVEIVDAFRSNGSKFTVHGFMTCSARYNGCCTPHSHRQVTGFSRIHFTVACFLFGFFREIFTILFVSGEHGITFQSRSTPVAHSDKKCAPEEKHIVIPKQKSCLTIIQECDQEADAGRAIF